MPVSDLLIGINAILLAIVLVGGMVMIHASGRYTWLTGLPDQLRYQKRILRILMMLVAVGLVAATINLFWQ